MWRSLAYKSLARSILSIQLYRASAFCHTLQVLPRFFLSLSLSLFLDNRMIFNIFLSPLHSFMWQRTHANTYYKAPNWIVDLPSTSSASWLKRGVEQFFEAYLLCERGWQLQFNPCAAAATTKALQSWLPLTVSRFVLLASRLIASQTY